MTRMQPYVFISYSRVDSAHASRISEVLTRCQTEHFLDSKDIDWGSDIEAGVSAAFIRSSHLLVIVSKFSLESLWVGYEIGHAKALGKTILPFLRYPNLGVPTLLSRLNFHADLGQVEDYFHRLMDAFNQMAA
jgi:TIR domain